MALIYRADDRTPQQLKQKGAMRTYKLKGLATVRKEVSEAIDKDYTVSYCKDHRQNRFSFALSCAIEQTCDGYAGVREYTYCMTFKNLRIINITNGKRLKKFPAKIKEKLPLLCIDKDTLDKSKIIGLGIPNSREIVILMDVPIEFITHYRIGSKGKWIKLDWSKVKSKLW
jgi:hypothetical protein